MTQPIVSGLSAHALLPHGVSSILVEAFVYAEPYIQISTESAKSADLVV